MDFIEPCFGIGHNLSLICQMTSEDIKHQLIIIIELRSSANANTVAVAQITGERGWRMEKVSLRRFLADQKIASFAGKKNAFWGIL